MLWQVRALLDDRPGAMAALATSCGEQNINILGLQIFPAADGRVVDELVLHTPGGWNAADVEGLCDTAGVHEPSVTTCSPHALEDQPVRYVRAAQILIDEPDRLEDQLCRLLDADPAEDVPGLETLVLDDGAGPAVALARAVPFTDTEVARATELRRLAVVARSGVHPSPSGALGSGRPAVPRAGRGVSLAGAPPADAGVPAVAVVWDPESPDQGHATARAEGTPAEQAGTAAAPAAPGAVVLRPGTAADADQVVAMHARCSSQTLLHRYHAPVAAVSLRMARAMLEPADGTSLVATVDGEVVGLGMTAAAPDGVELGLLVEDRRQRQGIGARLMRALALEAAGRGVTALLCRVQPDNTAVAATVRRADLRARVTWVDGLTMYEIPVGRLADAPRRRTNRPAMGEVTTPLVALLHDRHELRAVYPPADLIDQAVRGGA